MTEHELVKFLRDHGIGVIHPTGIAAALLDAFDITPKVAATAEQQDVMRARLG